MGGASSDWARAGRGLELEPPEPWAAWFCTYTPLELILAAGLEPCRLLGTPGRQGTADAYLTPNLCPYVRSVLAQALVGPLPVAAVVAASCNAMTHLFSAWAGYVGAPAHLLDLPRRADPSSLRQFARSLGELLAWLEGIGGLEATPARLGEAWEAVDGSRRALDRAHRLALDGGTLLEMSRAAQAAGPTRFVPAAEAFLAGPAAAPGPAPGPGPSRGGGESPGPHRRPQLLLTGSLLDPALVRLIEEAGARVAADDTCLGSRAWLQPEPRPPEPGGRAGGPAPAPPAAASPPRTREEWLFALAQRYLHRRPPCPREGDFERRARHLDQLLDAARPDGVVACALKFCDNALYDFPALRAHLARAGVPGLFLVEDYGGGDLGQLCTRVEAFLETLNGLRTVGRRPGVPSGPAAAGRAARPRDGQARRRGERR